jgi:phage gp29-like protein
LAKQVKPVLDEVAGTEKDFTLYSGYLGSGKYLANTDKLLRNPDKVLRTRGRGMELYEELMLDPQVRTCMQSRRLAVIGKEWEVLPAGADAQSLEIADFVKEALYGFDFDSARYALLGGIVLGFKLCEIVWEYSEGQVRIKELVGRSSRRFVFDAQGNPRLLTPKEMLSGEELPPRKFQVFRYGSENGSPYGEGLGETLYWPVWFKKNAIKFWMIFAEKFGSPTVIGKYPPGTPREHQDSLLGALEAIQQESAIKIPETMQIELLEARRTGTVDTYKDLCAFMNAEIAKTILGQTLTTEIGEKGSYAASKTHNEVRRDFVKADADLLASSLNGQLIKWIVDFNYPGVPRYPKLWIRCEEESDLMPLARRDEVIARMGLPIPKKYLYETYGIPEPVGGEETL